VPGVAASASTTCSVLAGWLRIEVVYPSNVTARAIQIAAAAMARSSRIVRIATRRLEMPLQPWEYWGLTEDDWNAGWRRTIRDAVDAEFSGKQTDDGDAPGEEFEIKIFARRRTDNAVHDYRVGS
jgi:hypothetical protein